MELFYTRYKRIFITALLVLCFWISGEVSMVYGMPFTGLSFVLLASAAALYFLLYYVVNRTTKHPHSLAYSNTERFVFSGVCLYISSTGIIESQPNNADFTTVFNVFLAYTILYVLVLLRNIYLQKKNGTGLSKSFINAVLFVAFVVGFARILLMIEEYGDSDALVIVAFIYFPLIIFLLFRWIFRQLKMVLNLKNEKAKTELMHLKSQVNPHFFFNMLNNLYGWVDKDPIKAKELIISLSEMMRYSIYEGDKNTVPLEDEVAYMEKYIELHRMRYHKEIDIQFTTEFPRTAIPVMPLLFIILLENAFKHGVENLREDAFVRLNMKADDQQVHFEIENNFDAKEVPTNPGIGLENLKRRLELVYPKKYALVLEADNEIYKATLTLDI